MIPAKELFDKMLNENEETTSTEMMIEFAKIHVTEALKQASDNAKIRMVTLGNEDCASVISSCYHSESGTDFKPEKISILTAYPLDNIK